MIFGIGIDVFEVKRIKSAIQQDAGFVDSIFTEEEISYCDNLKSKFQNYAARFSAKEAFMKALGTGWRSGIRFNDIAVINDELGKPSFKINGIAKEFVLNFGITSMHLSISHTKELATAYVILEKESKGKMNSIEQI